MRTTNEKRTKKITINLTPSEWELLQAICDHNERNESEQTRILLLKIARQEWGNISNLSPLTAFTGERNTTDTLGR